MRTPLERLNQGLVGRYVLTGEAGEGGMATVYRARDLRHDRQVAIKVLRPDLAAAIGAERFLAEIATTARLQHPNILPLFDSGEADGFLFYVMPFVEGPSLRTRLDQDGQLAVDEAVGITCAIAAALEHAHRHGVIHRDIKPENILLSDGVPVLADFGIALALERAGDRLTSTGMAIGTALYMSPEQALGEREVDARSDIYSLACVLYQALSGELPHTGQSARAITMKRLVGPPTPIRVLRPAVPEHVETALLRALAVTPADRFPHATDFAAALHRPQVPATEPLLVLRAEPRSYGVLMHEGDDRTLRQARASAHAAVESVIEASGGLLRQSPGDALVALFADPHACLACAQSAREAVSRLNAALPAQERVHYRFGIADADLPGDPVDREAGAVERASELAWVAPTDGINLSDPVRTQLGPQGVETVGTGLGLTAPHLVPPQLEGLDIPPPARPSIALMPFVCLGADPEGEAIAEGLRIDITNALMKIGGIFLTAPSTMNRFRGSAGPDTARTVGTRHVLEGTVRRSGDRVRVTMELTDTEAGGLVWTERYDRVLDDAFELQDEIAARVITELDVKLSMGDQARVWRKCLTHPAAREHYYRGLGEFFHATRDSVEAARAQFERVAKLVPDSPVGATWTALSLWLQATHGWDPTARQLAIEWARRAAAMPDADGQAHTVLGATFLLEHRWDEAVHIARDSVRIRPGCNTANGILANVLFHCGHYQEAVRHAKRAIRIGPIYPPWFLEILGSAHREAGDLDLAITVCREILRLAPDSVSGRLALASALIRDGWVAEARHVVRDVPRLEPDFTIDRYLENQPFRSYQVAGRLRSEWREAGLA